MKNYHCRDGITVAKLREILKDWPDLNRDGQPNEIWLGHPNGLSSVCSKVEILNLRENDEGENVADVLLGYYES